MKLIFALLLQVAQNPTNEEQLLIYELNRARENPVRYAQENGLGSLLDSVSPKPPLAVSNSLVGSASWHAEDMATRDYFAHQAAAPDNRWPNQVALDAGYLHPWPGNQNYIESLAAGYLDVQAALRGLIEDAGVNPPGHREHLLATGAGEAFFSQHREVGTGFALNVASTYDRYYAIHTAYINTTDLFLTGVVYADLNANGRYDLAEGLGGVTVSIGGTSVLSNPAGGWSMAIANGAYTVTATGGAFVGTGSANVTVAGANVEIDFASGAAAGEVNFANQPDPPTGGGGGGGGGSADDDDSGGGGCGLLGLDALTFLLLTFLLRRKSHQAATGFP